MSLKGMLDVQEGRVGKGRLYFLFVFICPTMPQLAHFRVVLPPAFEGVPVSSESPTGVRPAPFCFSRAKRLSLLRFNRVNSASSLTRKSCVSHLQVM
jgi:hypothetical protein